MRWRRARRLAVSLAAAALAASPGLAVDPYAVAAELAALGPRRPGSAAHAQGAELLLERMREAGLERVRRLPVDGEPALTNLVGVLPGALGGRIVLSAHYDSVAASPGAADDASGCAVALAAAADLGRTPLARTVEVLLFDGEEDGLLGSRAWLAGGEAGELDGILAGINLEMLGLAAAGPGVVLSLPAERRGRRRQAPGWLVHAALRGAEAGGLPLAVADPRLPLPAQIALRLVRVSFGVDSDAFVAAGVPALTLTDVAASRFDSAYHRPDDTAERLDAERLDLWARAVAATVRRLDALEGRPRPEDEYLAVFGRVWLRRELMWAGFAIWVLMVVRGLPGRWRGASVEERRRRGRGYLPGFVFRLVFLLALLTAPAIATPLLVPAGLASLARARGRAGRAAVLAVGLAPAACLLAMIGWGLVRGFVAVPWAEPLAPLLVLLTLALFAVTR